MTRLIITLGLASGLCLGVAQPGWAQRVVLAPGGDELLMSDPKDRACFDAWIDRVAEDESTQAAEGLEITLDCAPGDLGVIPNHQPGAKLTLSTEAGKCIRNLVKSGVIPPTLIPRIEKVCGPIRRAKP